MTEYLFQNYNICPNKEKKYYAQRRRYLSCSDPLTLGRVSAKNTIVAALYIFSFHYIAIAVTLYYCIFVHCYITISLLLPHTQNLFMCFKVILYIVLFTFGCICERDLTWQFTRCSRCSSVHRWHSFLCESGRSKKSPPLYFVNLVYNSGYIFAWTLSIIWSQYVYLGQSPQICTVIIFGKIFWIFLFCFHFPSIYAAFRLHLMGKIVVKLENFFYPFCANFRRSHVRTWDLRFSQIYMI